MSWKVKDRDACFICMKLLEDKRSPRSRPSHRRHHPPGKEKDGGPSQASSCGDDGSGNDSSNLLKKFLLIFSGNPKSKPSYWKVYEDIKGHKVFCDKCEATVTRLCDLYKELRELEMKLNWKLGDVGGLMESSGKSLEGEALFFAFSKPAGRKGYSKEDKWYSRKEVIKMREGLATNCKSRADQGKCKVVIKDEEGEAAAKLLQSPLEKPVNLTKIIKIDDCEIGEDLVSATTRSEGEADSGLIGSETREHPEMDEEWIPQPPEKMEVEENDDDPIDDDIFTDLFQRDEEWGPLAPVPLKKKRKRVNASDSGHGPKRRGRKPKIVHVTKLDGACSDPETLKKFSVEIALKIEANNLDCDICQISFVSRAQFKLHMEVRHHGNPNRIVWRCGYCPLEFETPLLKRRHRASAHPPAQRRTATTRRPRNSNPTTAQEERWIKTPCELCGKRFTSMSNHYTHLIKRHERQESNEKRVGKKCFFCSKSYAIDSLMEFHLANHRHAHVKMEFPCDHIDCQQFFDTVTKLTDHLNSDHAGQELVKCSGCGWPFLNKPMLELHELVHLPNNRHQNFSCPKCDHKSVRFHTLEDHYNEAHLGDLFLYKCHECGVLSRSKISSVNHHRIHHNSLPAHVINNFKCEQCGAWFRERCQLNEHVRQEHTGKTHICNVCQEGFPTMKELRSHSHAKHPLPPPSTANHICSECGKGYRIPFLLKKHMRTAHLDRFECHICNKVYRRQRGLQIHIKNEHELGKEARKPGYICSECGKGYFSNNNLKNHMKQVHLPEDESNPLYKCSRCHKKWAKKCDYSDHLGTSCWKNADPLELAAAMAGGIKIRIRDRRKGKEVNETPIKSLS